MKSVKVNWRHQRPTESYTSIKPQYSWMAPLVNGVWQQSTGFHSCRETFCGAFKRFIRSTKLGQPAVVLWPPNAMIDTKRFRFAIMLSQKAKKDRQKYFRCGIKLVHILESELGWAKTAVYAPAGFQSQTRDCFLMSGSAKWLRSPQLISMYLLMFRLGAAKHMDKVNTLEDLEKFGEKPVPKDGTGQVRADLGYLCRTVRYWRPIFENIDDIFLFRSQTESWAVSNGTQGIQKLVSGDVDAALGRKFKEIKKQFSAGKGK